MFISNDRVLLLAKRDPLNMISFVRFTRQVLLLTKKLPSTSLNRKPIGTQTLPELGGEQRRPFAYCKSNTSHPTSVTQSVTFKIL